MALARRRLFPSHGIMAANDWKRPGSGSLQISLGRRGKFPLPVLLLFFSLEGVRRRGACSSLQKHPFLLAQRRRAMRNGCFRRLGLLTGYSFLCSFLLQVKCSVPIVLIFMVCDSEFLIKRFQRSHGFGASLLAEHIPTPHPLR